MFSYQGRWNREVLGAIVAISTLRDEYSQPQAVKTLLNSSCPAGVNNRPTFVGGLVPYNYLDYEDNSRRPIASISNLYAGFLIQGQTVECDSHTDFNGQLSLGTLMEEGYPKGLRGHIQR